MFKVTVLSICVGLFGCSTVSMKQTQFREQKEKKRAFIQEQADLLINNYVAETKNKKFYASQKFIQFENGEELVYLSHQLTPIPGYESFLSSTTVVKGKAIYKSKTKEAPVEISIYVESDPNKQSNSKIFVGSGLISEEDHLKKFRSGDPKILNTLKKRSIYQGMSEEALVASIGPPQKINLTVVGNRESKQYVYSLGKYVYIANGKVTGYQLTK